MGFEMPIKTFIRVIYSQDISFRRRGTYALSVDFHLLLRHWSYCSADPGKKLTENLLILSARVYVAYMEYAMIGMPPSNLFSMTHCNCYPASCYHQMILAGPLPGQYVTRLSRYVGRLSTNVIRPG